MTALHDWHPTQVRQVTVPAARDYGKQATFITWVCLRCAKVATLPEGKLPPLVDCTLGGKAE